MLKDALTMVCCENDNKFEGAGIILYSPFSNLFYKIAFGDGCNSDDLTEGCDDYMYLTIDKYNEDGDFEEDVDGGQLDFNRKNYTGYINDEKLIRDCLEFMDCGDIDSLIFIRKFNH